MVIAGPKIKNKPQNRLKVYFTFSALLSTLLMSGCTREDNPTLCHPRDWTEVDMVGHCEKGDALLIRDIQKQEGAPYSLAYMASLWCEVPTITLVPDEDGSLSVVCHYAGKRTPVYGIE